MESGGIEMRVTNIAGVQEGEAKRQNSAGVSRQKSVREGVVSGKAAVGKEVRSREVQEKLLQEAEGATVAISAEGLGLVQKEEAEENAYLREQNEKQMYQEMMENTREAAEAQGEGFGDLAKAMEIARRILNGDIVPAQDEKFLMEFNSEMYMRVKSMAERKEDPEKYDSLLEEEEDENGNPGSGSSGGVRSASGTDEAQADGEAAASEGAEGTGGKETV